MHTSTASPPPPPINAVPPVADFISINAGPSQPAWDHNGRLHNRHHHHQHHHYHTNTLPDHLYNRSKRKRECSGAATTADLGDDCKTEKKAGDDAKVGDLQPHEMESPALRSPWVPPGREYATGVLG
jgi:hypothetical protein